MAKQQQTENEDLFNNLDISGFENALIEVGEPDTEKLNEEVVETTNEVEEPGDGDPDKVKKPGKISGRETDTIIVDTGVEEEEEPTPDGDDDKEKSKLKGPKEKKKGGGTPQEENESPVYLHAAALQEYGVLPNFDLKSLDGLEPEKAILKMNEHIQSQITESIKEGIDEYKSTLGERAKEFIDSLEEGIPFEELRDNYTLEQRYNDLSSKTLEENEELQEQVYADYLSLKGFSDAKIKKYVDIAKEKESLLVDSVDGLKEIQATIEEDRKEMIKAAKADKLAKEERNIKVKDTIKKSVKETKEIIPGIELNDEEREDIIKRMTIPVNFVNKDGKKIPMSSAMAARAKNPLLFEMRLAYFVKNGFFDENIKKGAFDIFTKKIETSATKRLSQVLNNEKRITGKSQAEKDKEKVNIENEESDFIFPQQIINH